MATINSDILDAAQDILNKLRQIKDDSGNILFQTVAIWNAHYERLVSGKGYSFATPAVFVEFQWKQSTVFNMGLVGIDLDVVFHVVHQELDAGDGTMDQNLSQYALRRAIIREMTEFYPTGMSGFMYAKGQGDYNHTNTYHRLVTFKTIYLDQDALYTNTGQQYYRNPPVTLIINGVRVNTSGRPQGIGYDLIGRNDVIE